MSSRYNRDDFRRNQTADGAALDDEMVKALAFLRSRLRADTDANREELAQRHAEMDAGKNVRWEDLKRQLGLS